MLMVLPPVTYEHRFGLGDPPLLPISVSRFPLAKNQHILKRPSTVATLEIELIDIVFVENKGWSQQELAAVDQFEFT